MKILFLHPNFPAQFKQVALHASRLGHDVKFLCQTHFGRTLEGVDRLTLKEEASHQALETLRLSIHERTEALAKQYRKGFSALRKAGWSPDIVISHSGWGCGTYIKEIWPKCKQISYLEWWFDPQSSFFTENSDKSYLGKLCTSTSKNWLRNQNIALELVVADKIISPTKWQRNQLPEKLKKYCQVIFDGIDLTKFKPIENDSLIRNKIITYGTRGMDPMRCFPQLISSLPEFFAEKPDWNLEIAGIDEAFYGQKYAKDKQTWGKWALELLKREKLISKVRFLGRLGPGTYENWLKTSNCHIYLTHPFVVSWSLVESYCCGAPIITSNVEAVRDICTPEDNVNFIDHDSSDLGSIISKSLDSLGTADRRRTTIARNVERYGSSIANTNWELVAGL